MKADRNSRSRRGRATGNRDAIAIALVVVAVFSFGAALNLFDRFDRFLDRSSPVPPDDILAIATLTAIGFAVYGFRRSKQLTRETHLRRETEQRFRSLVEEVPAITYTWDARRPAGEAPPAYVSPQIEAILGYSVEEWSEHPASWLDHIHPDDRDRVRRSSEESDRTGNPFREEYRIRRKDGRYVWVYDESVTVERDPSGRPLRAQGVMYDVTARKEAELRLQEAENRYRTIVERVPAVAYVWDTAFEPGAAPVTYISPQIERLLGYTADAWLADPELWRACAHPDDARVMLEGWNEAVAAKTSFVGEYRMTRADGSEVWIRDEAVPIGESPSGATLYQGVMFDITDAKRTEEQLRTAEERYRMLIEHLPVVTYVSAAWVGDEQQTPRYIASGIEELLGYTVEEWLADAAIWDRSLSADDREAVLLETERCVEQGLPFDMEYRLERKDGHTIWVRDQAVILERGPGTWGNIWQGVFQDITERKAAEDLVRSAESQFRALVEQIPAITYAEDPVTGENLYVSPQIETIFGYTAEEWMTDPELWTTRLHPDDRDWVVQENDADTGDSWSVDYRTYTRDGRLIWVHNEAVLIRDEDGRPRFWQGVVSDITERKLSEERLRAAEGRYRTLVEQLPAVVYVDAVDDASTALYISPQYEQLLGYTAQERMADPGLWRRILHPDDLDRVVAESLRTNETGDPFDVEYRLVRKDGGVVWVHDYALLVKGEDDGPGEWQGVLTDITERKLAFEDLSRRDRILEAAGFAAERFLHAQAYYDVIDDVLERVGEVLGASRAYLFENEHDAEGRLLSSQRFEWVAEGVTRTIAKGASQHYPYVEGGFERWERTLGAGDVVHGLVSDFPETERPFLEGEDILSLCAVPVSVAGTWWGYVGFDQCDAERDWQPSELDALRVIASTLGAAIGREDAERKLSETEARYRTLVEQIPAITYMVDAASKRVVYMSPQLESVLGYTRDEWGPTSYRDTLHPDDRERVLEVDARTDETGEPYRVEFRQRAKDGRWVWIRDEAVLIRDERGNPLYWQGVRFDITAQKEAEQHLREAEGRYRTLVEQMPAVTYIDGPADDPGTKWVSPQIAELLGFSPDEWVDGGKWLTCLHPDDRDEIVAADLETDATGEPFNREYRMVHRDGHVVWVLDKSVAILDDQGRQQYWQGVYFDITALKEAEQALHTAEERYRTLVETIPAATYIDTVDDLSKAIYMSPQVEQIFGYTPEEWANDPGLWEQGLHPDDHDRVVASVERLNRQGARYEAEYRFKKKDGTWKWVRDQAVLIRDEDGTPLYSQGFMFDITERMEAIDQLRGAEERFRGIVEHVPAAIYVDVPDGSMETTYVSPQIEEIWGLTPEEYVTDPNLWLDLMDPQDQRDAIYASYVRAIEEHTPWEAEYRIRRADGRLVWVHDETTFVHDEDGRPIFVQGVMYDVTERKLAEEALRASEQREREAAERLRALDEMKNTFLAAVSHELRSPLTSILGLSLTLERQDALSEEDRTDLLDRLAANARKLDRLLKDLLDIDRLNRGIVSPQYRVTDVGALARRTVESLDSLAERTIVAETDPVVITVDPAKVERIVENLLVNAARHTEVKHTIWLRVRAQDDGVLIAVDDDGPGVPPELREAIFEPFRQGPTASKASPGTGIGLSLVARFAELHGGRAWVEDREGGGASFRVFLPAGPGSAAAATGGNGRRPDDRELADAG